MVCPWCVLSAEIEELFRNVYSQLTVILFVDSKSINNGSSLYFVSFFHVFFWSFLFITIHKISPAWIGNLEGKKRSFNHSLSCCPGPCSCVLLGGIACASSTRIASPGNLLDPQVPKLRQNCQYISVSLNLKRVIYRELTAESESVAWDRCADVYSSKLPGRLALPAGLCPHFEWRSYRQEQLDVGRTQQQLL